MADTFSTRYGTFRTADLTADMRDALQRGTDMFELDWADAYAMRDMDLFHIDEDGSSDDVAYGWLTAYGRELGLKLAR